jgi:hypothetical protein
MPAASEPGGVAIVRRLSKRVHRALAGSGDEFRVGPHIMIVGLDQKMLQTLNQDGSNGEPYVNHLPGHPELFLVIPIREWDDHPPVHAVGAATR